MAWIPTPARCAAAAAPTACADRRTAAASRLRPAKAARNRAGVPQRLPAKGRAACWALLLLAASGSALAQPAGLPAARPAAGEGPIGGGNATPASAPLAPLSLEAPWRRLALPNPKIPPLSLRLLPGGALRLEAQAGYGGLVHELPGLREPLGRLSWRWRLEQAGERSNLRTRAGDDAAVKVCAMFDLPLDKVPFVERQVLRLARQRSAEPLPGATVCYVWAPELPAGTVLPNVYSARMRWIALRGSGDALGGWVSEQRDLAADFRRAFGDESSEVPPLVAIVVGADMDNTGGHSVAEVADLRLSAAGR